MPQNDLQIILLAILVPTAVLVVLIIVVVVAIMYLRMRRRLDSKFTPQRELPSDKDISVHAGWFCSPMSPQFFCIDFLEMTLIMTGLQNTTTVAKALVEMLKLQC